MLPGGRPCTDRFCIEGCWTRYSAAYTPRGAAIERLPARVASSGDESTGEASSDTTSPAIPS